MIFGQTQCTIQPLALGPFLYFGNCYIFPKLNFHFKSLVRFVLCYVRIGIVISDAKTNYRFPKLNFNFKSLVRLVFCYVRIGIRILTSDAKTSYSYRFPKLNFNFKSLLRFIFYDRIGIGILISDAKAILTKVYNL